MVLMNMSVWQSIESLAEFTYGAVHREVMRDRRLWFEKPTEAYLVLWWISAGAIPTVPDAVHRLESLRHHGPTAEAFTFRSPFPPPGEGTGTTCTGGRAS